MISVERVTRAFETAGGEFTAVRDVSFGVAKGRFVSLVGPSGCGKTTLLGMIAGLVPVTEGRIALGGRAVTGGVPPDIGYLFQRDALLPWKTALQNVALPLTIRGVRPAEARGRAVEWMRRVGLAGFEGYYPHQLSGGMRKRVSLATTLIYGPTVLLMDEPFSALDVQTRNLMENELLDLWAETRNTVLFITHDLEEAIALSDEVVVLTAGPGRVKASYPIPLARPRNVVEIRFREEFTRLYEQIWKDLRDEVQQSYARATRV
ncbi:MAG TPA: ABC transporter ATP-binding protein [Methylomirabilota bacterium]|nr:ABC transporter ATP-binding protein [Methylomirabilota bacterium]